MDPTDPKQCDQLDLREAFKHVYPSYGPDWDAAIEYGIDVGQLEFNLSLTPTQRLLQLHQMTITYELAHSKAQSGHS
jgi:hypothetical protein